MSQLKNDSDFFLCHKSNEINDVEIVDRREILKPLVMPLDYCLHCEKRDEFCFCYMNVSCDDDDCGLT